MDTLEAIKRRRTIRKFQDKEIPHEVLHAILDAGIWAPSAGNIPVLKYLIVEDEKQKKIVAKAALDQKWLITAPIIIIVCSNTEAIAERFPKRGKTYALQDTAAAIENIFLAATSLGVASGWAGAFTETRLRTEFNIPDGVEIHAIIALGYAAETISAPPRPDLADISFFHRWGNKARHYKTPWVFDKEISPYPLEKHIPKIKKRIKKTAKKIAGKLKSKRRRKNLT